MKLLAPLPITPQATIHGIDDWLVFYTTAAGEWRYLSTECSGHWLDCPYSDTTEQGVLWVGCAVLLHGEKGFVAYDRPIESDCLADTIAHFG